MSGYDPIKFSYPTLLGYCIEWLFAFLLPIVLWIVWRRKTKAAARPLVIGFFGYMVTSWVKAFMRNVVIAGITREVNWLYYLLLVVVCSVLEEMCRFVCMKYPLQCYDRWIDGVSYGIGHGGCELMLSTSVISLNSFLEGLDCNKNGMSGIIQASTPEETEKLYNALKLSSENNFYDNLLTMLHCVFEMGAQIGLSLLVLSAVFYVGCQKQLFVAMALHTAINFFPQMLLDFKVPYPKLIEFGIFGIVLLYVFLVWRRRKDKFIYRDEPDEHDDS